MSKDIDKIAKNIIAANKDIINLDNSLSKDVTDLKKSIKTINTQLTSLNEKVDQILEIMNTFTIMLSEEDEQNDEWTPYDEDNFDFGDSEEDNL